MCSAEQLQRCFGKLTAARVKISAAFHFVTTTLSKSSTENIVYLLESGLDVKSKVGVQYFYPGHEFEFHLDIGILFFLRTDCK